MNEMEDQTGIRTAEPQDQKQRHDHSTTIAVTSKLYLKQ